MTMALPLAFAACTSEEFESYDSNVSLAQRTEIGQVDLTFGFGDAQTRWDAGLNEEVSDVLGAALIDAPKTTPINDPDKGKWETHFNITDYISTNYPYTFNGERWTSPAKLVEGSYLFYAPYANDHQVRTAIEYAAPVKQNVTVENGKVVAMSGIADMGKNFTNPFYFGYKFFDATDDNRNVQVTLRHVFAYPKFTLKNETGEPVTITRILVQDGNNSIPAEGEFRNSAIAADMNNTEEGWGAADDLNMKYNLKTTDLLNTNAETYKTTNLVRADLEEAVTIADGASMEVNIVMPAMAFAQNDMTVYFVTESGKAYTGSNSTTTINLVPGRNYPAEDYQQNGTLKSSAGQLLTTTIDETDQLVDAPYIVTSTQELIDAINDTPANLTSHLKLTIAGEVEFNETVLRTIAEVMSQPVVLIGKVDIVGGSATAPLNIDQKVIFDEADVTGNVIFDNDMIAYDKLTVAENAALVVTNINENGYNKEGETRNNTTIINNGTLTLVDAVEDVKNYGELIINQRTVDSQIVSGKFTDLETDDEKPQTVTLNTNYTYTGNELSGTWTVAEGYTLTLGAAATLPYESTLTVNGRLAGQALTVSGTMDVEGTIANSVTVSGKVDDPATTTVNERKEAIVNMKSGAMLLGTIQGQSDENTDAQIVNIADSSVGLAMGTFINTDLKAQYTHNGNITKPADLNVPAQVNTVIIDGDINAADDTRLTLTSIREVVVEGNVNATNGNVTFETAGSSKVTIEGDVYAGKNVKFENATKIEVEGTLVTSTTDGKITAKDVTEATLGGLRLNGGQWGDVSNLEKLTIEGDVQLYQTMDMGTAELVLKGNVTIAKDIELRLSTTTTIDGDVTVEGAGKMIYDGDASEGRITINAGAVLRNGGTIEGNAKKSLAFSSEEAEAGKAAGQMYNNGEVNYSKYTYGQHGWWHGKDANKGAGN